jgi:hypothetical protein
MGHPNERLHTIEAAVRNPPEGKRLYELVRDTMWYSDCVYEEVGCLRKEVKHLTRLITLLLEGQVLIPPDMKQPGKRWFMRPVFKVSTGKSSSETLTNIAVCTTNNDKIFVDEQVVAWFPHDATGEEIRQEYRDNLSITLTWGKPLTYT